MHLMVDTYPYDLMILTLTPFGTPKFATAVLAKQLPGKVIVTRKLDLTRFGIAAHT